MIPVRQAIEAAKAAAIELFGRAPPELRLEEVDKSATDGLWYITLGWLVDKDPTNLATRFLTAFPAPERIYKVFEIDGSSGEFVRMKNRE